jgi:hypothetical protein
MGIISFRFGLWCIHDQETASPLMRPSCAMPGPLLLVAALALPGRWSAPVASVQPKGTPRLIQGAIRRNGHLASAGGRPTRRSCPSIRAIAG